MGRRGDPPGEHAPGLSTTAPLNVAVLEASAPAAPTRDLGAIWTVPQPVGATASNLAMRRIDDKGRLVLPVQLPCEDRALVPAERSGAVLTVFLPGTDATPAPARSVASLPRDARGRLAISTAVRREMGWVAGTDLLAQYNEERHVLALCAASAIQHLVAAALTTVAATSTPAPTATA